MLNGILQMTPFGRYHFIEGVVLGMTLHRYHLSIIFSLRGVIKPPIFYIPILVAFEFSLQIEMAKFKFNFHLF
jgi:hypothetical protein